MVARLVGAALAHRAVVFMLAIALVATGGYLAFEAPLDVFPEFAPPIVEIQTEAVGLAAEDVEALVTTPLELALGGAPEIAALRSSSGPGLSVVTVFFPYGTDPYRARQFVIERLALTVEQLPAGVRPAVAPLQSALSTILAIGLRSGSTLSPLELRTLAEWTIRPRLLAVPGVADVVLYGGSVREIQITTTPERLWAAGVTLDDLTAAATEADAAAGSGFLDRVGQRLPTWLDGRLHDLGDLARAPLPARRDGSSLPLGAVAEVAEGPAVPVGDATVNGEPGVMLLVTRQPGVNVIEVTAAVEKALQALIRTLPSGVEVDAAMFRQATFIEHALGNLRRALIAGALLVSIVLFAFVGNVRAAFISVVAIPLSLLSAVAVLSAAGVTLNVMTLGGLAIAVGEVVDDAIIDVENAWRRLRSEPQARPLDVVLAASIEVRSAVVYATLVVAFVFLPVLALTGLEGALFRPLALTYVLATLASLVVALTVTPALVLVLLPAAAARQPQPSRLGSALRTRYERVLDRVLKRPRPVITTAIVTVLAGVVALPLLRLEFLPEFHETNFVMHMTGAPGVGLDESSRVGRAAAREILQVPGVRSVAQVIGRSTLSEDTWGAERSELLVQLEPGAAAAEATEQLRAHVGKIAGFAFDLKQYLNERIEELLAGTGADLVVRLRGADLAGLEQAARLVSERVSAIPGAVDVYAPGSLTAPGVRVRPRREDLLRLGVSAAAVEHALRSALGGLPAGHLVEGGRQAAVVVRTSGEVSGDPAGLARLPFTTVGGQVMQLGSVADVEVAPLRTGLTHEDGVRTVLVRLDARGRSLGAVAADVAAAVRELTLPAGVYVEIGGEYEAARAARRRLMGVGVLALLGIAVLLLVDFRSPRLTAMIMVNVPLAFVGGIAAVLLGAGGRLSLGAIVGFVTVFGITIRNGIMLVARFRQVAREHGAPLEHAQLVAAAGDRLAPILMTAFATAVALVPLLALSERAGGEIEHPMALVIVGGVITSTFLNLFVVPTWYAYAAPAPLGMRPR